MCLIFIQTQTQGEFGWWCHRPISGGIEVQYPATLGEFLFSESSLDQNSDSSDIMIYSRADIPCRIGGWGKMPWRLNGQRHNTWSGIQFSFQNCFISFFSVIAIMSPRGAEILKKINVKVPTEQQKKTKKQNNQRNKGGTLTRSLWQAGSSDFCCQLEASLTFQLPYPSVCSPGGDLSGGNKMRGAIIFPLLLYSWPDNQSAGAQGLNAASSPMSHPANIYGKHTNTVLTHSPYCVLCVCVSVCVNLCGTDKYDSFRSEGEIEVCNPRLNT